MELGTSRHVSEGRLVATVEAFIDQRELIPPAATILAGVSGGMDSVAMLAILRELSAGRGWRLIVAHFNHALRVEADEDARFVESLAGQWQLPCVSEKGVVAEFARVHRQGLEQAGRNLRYEFFRRQALLHGAGFVAVAHHADDNVETVLHRILRGTHVRGLAGIPVKRALGGMAAVVCRHDPTGVEGTRRGEPPTVEPLRRTDPVFVVRPMLAVRRSQIERFCRERGLAWRTDASNQDVRFRRNYIRNKLLPQIRLQVSENVDTAILQLAAAAEQIEGLLKSQAVHLLERATTDRGGDRYSLDVTLFGGSPPIVQTTALRMALEDMGVPLGDVGREHLEGMLAVFQADGPPAASLPGLWRLERQGPQACLHRPAEAPPGVDEGETLLACPGLTVLSDGRQVRCEVKPLDPAEFGRHIRGHAPGVEWLDADALDLPLTCRRRRKGDRFDPLGAGGQQSVSDFLTDHKFRHEQRRLVRCICDRQGIVYLAPYRICQRAKVAGNTRNGLRIEIL